MKKMISLCLISGLMLAAGDARAELGKAGTKAVLGDMDVRAGWSHQAPPEGEGDADSATAVSFGVTGSYFVAERVSVGGRFAMTYQSSDGETMKGGGVGVLVGYAAPIGERLYLWPQAGLVYGRATTSELDGISYTSIGAQAYAPLYYEPAEHVLIGIGPFVSTQLVATFDFDGDSIDGDKTSTVALLGSLAGWF